ncbi:hypothetical protein OV450_6576 [Actinobacteria bacterium OV450]|uniref:hypothetical protein n=1 Tax=Streptomyces sp. NPDC056387 TaxID=3345803 RepID=UPI0006BA7B1D|nr:hypothetical protein OV450_6576 [Actinobacteria bacterium OV450]
MAPRTFITEWDAESGVLEAVRAPTGDRTDGRTPPTGPAGETPIGFRAVASVGFAPDGGVCAVNVPDIPERVAPAIPTARDAETVGNAWLDSGWLWIPLSGDPAEQHRSGLAEIELRLRSQAVTGLSLRFLDEVSDRQFPDQENST